MTFRTKHIADSVVERINAVADSIENDAPMPASRGAAVINLDRQDNGDLAVTKTYENGETELLTISNQPSGEQPPEGLIQIGGGEAPTVAQQLPVGDGTTGIIENAALGGDSLDALLRG